ncbi:Uncharacterised protein [Clostridium sporogenes]|nr:Uncharacterised protein [Clostridium sporogenes]
MWRRCSSARGRGWRRSGRRLSHRSTAKGSRSAACAPGSRRRCSIRRIATATRGSTRARSGSRNGATGSTTTAHSARSRRGSRTISARCACASSPTTARGCRIATTTRGCGRNPPPRPNRRATQASRCRRRPAAKATNPTTSLDRHPMRRAIPNGIATRSASAATGRPSSSARPSRRLRRARWPR